jgi:hypothetical protein
MKRLGRQHAAGAPVDGRSLHVEQVYRRRGPPAVLGSLGEGSAPYLPPTNASPDERDDGRAITQEVKGDVGASRGQKQSSVLIGGSAIDRPDGREEVGEALLSLRAEGLSTSPAADCASAHAEELRQLVPRQPAQAAKLTDRVTCS